MIKKSSLTDISENREILIREDNFAYLLPCDQLKGLLSNFTISFPDRTIISDDYTIMPHGSVTLVLFHYHAGFHSFLFGPATKPVRVGDIANKCDVIFIIEFQPAGFSPLINIDQKDLTDRIVPLSQIAYTLDETMCDIFKTSLTVDMLLFEMERNLISHIQNPYPGELALAVKEIIHMQGVMSSKEISDHVFYCTRHLNRLFNQYLGMSMKSFSRLVRINNSIRMLDRHTDSLDSICERLGYYDSSHFVKDFKSVCNITPQEYRMRMSDFYSEIAKY